jgi:hypothetical protein
VRPQTPGGELDRGLHFIHGQAARVGLVGESRVGVPVGDDDLAGGEGRLDRVLDELGAGGQEQQQLGAWGDVRVRRVQE